MARQRGRRSSNRQHPYHNGYRNQQNYNNHHNNQHNNYRSTFNDRVIDDSYLPIHRRHNRHPNDDAQQLVDNNNNNNNPPNENRQVVPDNNNNSIHPNEDNENHVDNNNNAENNNAENNNVDNNNQHETLVLEPTQRFVSFPLLETVHPNNELIARLMNDINNNDERIEIVQRELSNLVERRRLMEVEIRQEERRLDLVRQDEMANGIAPLVDENGVAVTENEIDNLQWYVHRLITTLTTRDDRYDWYNMQIQELQRSGGDDATINRLRYQLGIYARDNLGCRLIGYRSWGGDHAYLYRALKARGLF